MKKVSVTWVDVAIATAVTGAVIGWPVLKKEAQRVWETMDDRVEALLRRRLGNRASQEVTELDASLDDVHRRQAIDIGTFITFLQNHPKAELRVKRSGDDMASRIVVVDVLSSREHPDTVILFVQREPATLVAWDRTDSLADVLRLYSGSALRKVGITFGGQFNWGALVFWVWQVTLEQGCVWYVQPGPSVESRLYHIYRLVPGTKEGSHE